MAANRKPLPFEPEPPAAGKGKAGQRKAGQAKGSKRRTDDTKSTAGTAGSQAARGSQVIPPAVANRMARRIALATGVPSLLGMGVFLASYLLVSRGIADIPPVVTLAASGGLFLLGVLGLSYGVLSASWEPAPGSLLGFEQIGVNIQRVRASIRAMRQGGNASGTG